MFGALSGVGAAGLFFVLLAWLFRGRDSDKKDLNEIEVTLRTILCWFLVQLSLCDFLTSCAYIMSYFTELYSASWFCILEAIVMTIFEGASLLWTASVAFLLYISSQISVPVTKPDYTLTNKRLTVYATCCFLISWGLPVFSSLLIFWMGGFGKGTHWCWIRKDDQWWIGRLLCFYVPLLLVMIFIIMMLLLFHANFRKQHNIFNTVIREEPEWSTARLSLNDDLIYETRHNVYKSWRLMVWFSVIFVCLWTWPLIVEVVTLTGRKYLALSLVQAITGPLQGFCNFVTFGVIYLEFPCCLLTMGLKRIPPKKSYYRLVTADWPATPIGDEDT